MRNTCTTRLLPSLLLIVATACGGNKPGVNGDGGVPTPDLATPGPFTDFPADPVLDTGVPANAAALFADTAGTASGGPCMLEPEDNSLFPRNWLRMRFHHVAPGGQNLFEIRVKAASEINDLVVYTNKATWTMPGPMWALVTSHLVDEPITITIRGAVFDGTKLTTGPSLGSTHVVSIAPVSAAGAIVYWTTSGGSSLKGFKVGDEAVVPILAPPQVEMRTAGNAQVTCIGCHTSTPDGLHASFTAQGPWANALGSIDTAQIGKRPAFLTDVAVAALGQPQLGIHTYSKAHWAAGDHIQIAPFGPGAGSKLAWFNLEATVAGEGNAYGFLARTGDTHGAGAPTWSHDGKTIVYVSNDVNTDGRLDNGAADLYSVPYNDKAGGAATPIPGASDPTVEEYYPAYAPDDKLLAFDRIPNNTNMYNAPTAEVFVIPSEGGTPTRIKANDPPACSGKKSPGVTNSWPKWAPEVGHVGSSRDYYWITFSSTRGVRGNPQLYIAAVVVDRGEVDVSVATYSALYLWNQPEMENNHTPAWDVFQIPVQ
jgi:hypothetical protein